LPPDSARTQAGIVQTAGAELDDVDQSIVRLLVANGRMRTCEIATSVGLSESSTSVRLRRLVRSGVISGFHADVNPSAFGQPFHASVELRLDPHTSRSEFERNIAADPQVIDGWESTGSMDYHLRLACAGIAELDAALVRLRHAGAEETVTALLLRRIS
jgi:Lrp/AsnC family transcriptional regulator, leucine-responsive regulatory protein